MDLTIINIRSILSSQLSSFFNDCLRKITTAYFIAKLGKLPKMTSSTASYI